MKSDVLLGISNHLSGACIIMNNAVSAAISEERLTRKKRDSTFPYKSIEYVLDHCSLSLKDCAHICYGWSSGISDHNTIANLYASRLQKLTNNYKLALCFERLFREIVNDEKGRFELHTWAEKNEISDRLVLIDHHHSHAVGAHACSPFDSSISISCDGRGDLRSLAVYQIGNGNIKNIFNLSTLDSFGFFYGRITHLLGFIPDRHEGKVTGLAAYGNCNAANDFIAQMVNPFDLEAPFYIGDFYQPNYHTYSASLLEEVQKYDSKDIAASAQWALETYFTNLIQHITKEYGRINLCLSGGVFGNVRLNQRIAEQPNIANIFVLPCMGDEGHPLSAPAAFLYSQNGSKTSLNSMRLGKEVDTSKIEDLVHRLGKQVRRLDIDSLQCILIDELHKGSIVGLIRGRSEFGPRALLGRSIISSPLLKKQHEILNSRLDRDNFMPFAPIVSNKFAPKCFTRWDQNMTTSLYMTQTFNCTSSFITKAPAVVHCDGTSRPQIVPDTDIFMAQVLSKWEEKTGCPALINTSFNKHEEPIIETLQDGLEALLLGVVDCLFIADQYYVK